MQTRLGYSAIRATEWTNGERGYTLLSSGLDSHDSVFNVEGGLLSYLRSKQGVLGRPVRILDYGCGMNQLSRDLVKELGDVVECTGISAGDPRSHEEKEFDYENGVHFFNQQINAFPKTGKFDLITSLTTFIHLPDPLRTLKQMYSRLEVGGEIRVSCDEYSLARGFFDNKDEDSALKDAHEAIKRLNALGIPMRFLDGNLQIIKTEKSPQELPLVKIVQYKTPSNEKMGYGAYRLKLHSTF